MGRYLNPGNYGFQAIRAGEYIDRSGLISLVNAKLDTKQKFLCISRARRFGKSFAAQMLCAYYDRECDSDSLFRDLCISKDNDYHIYLNKLNVIYIDVTRVIGDAGGMDMVVPEIKRRIVEDVAPKYPEVQDRDNLTDVLSEAVDGSGIKFFIIIDEWDALFREAKSNKKVQDAYIDFLRTLFKDSGTTDKIFAGAYMTGILPIKKYGTQSAVTDFYEYTMTDPGKFAEYIGFTENEVRAVCSGPGMDFQQMKYWYDGYRFPETGEIYNPNSVMNAVERGRFAGYWTRTESYESLRLYIDMDFDALAQAIIAMLGGARVRLDIETFQNDLTNIENKDDVLTLLIHLGYLAYDLEHSEVFIPNEEIRREFVRTVRNGRRKQLVKLIQTSDKLLAVTLAGDEAWVSD